MLNDDTRRRDALCASSATRRFGPQPLLRMRLLSCPDHSFVSSPVPRFLILSSFAPIFYAKFTQATTSSRPLGVGVGRPQHSSYSILVSPSPPLPHSEADRPSPPPRHLPQKRCSPPENSCFCSGQDDLPICVRPAYPVRTFSLRTPVWTSRSAETETAATGLDARRARPCKSPPPKKTTTMSSTPSATPQTSPSSSSSSWPHSSQSTSATTLCAAVELTTTL